MGIDDPYPSHRAARDQRMAEPYPLPGSFGSAITGSGPARYPDNLQRVSGSISTSNDPNGRRDCIPMTSMKECLMGIKERYGREMAEFAVFALLSGVGMLLAILPGVLFLKLIGVL